MGIYSVNRLCGEWRFPNNDCLAPEICEVGVRKWGGNFGRFLKRTQHKASIYTVLV